MTQGGPNTAVGLFLFWRKEFELLRDPTTRAGADLTRLIEASKTSAVAFDACLTLWRFDQAKEGMPNWQLRQWGTLLPARPPERKRGLDVAFRNAALTNLIAEAVTLGFNPYKNSATGESRQSACEVVREALAVTGLPAPTISALEQIWKTGWRRIRWLTSESSH